MKQRVIFKFLLIFAGLSSFLNCYAQNSYPSKPIHFVVPQPAGGTSDTLARMWGEYVSKAVGTTVIVENKPGANGSIAASYVAKQAPDGYNVFLAGVSNLALNPFIYKTLSYSPTKDFDGVGLLVETPYLLVASKKSGIENFQALILKAKENPDKLNFASAGLGNGTHLVMEMLMRKTGIKMTHVPFNGSVPALSSVVGGQTDLMTDVLATGGKQASAGNVTPLAVLGTKRNPTFPDTPTLEDLGIKDFPYPNWYAIVVPAGTPKEIVNKLNVLTIDFLKDATVRTRLDAMGLSPMPTPPSAVKEYTDRDSSVWGPIIKELGVGGN